MIIVLSLCSEEDIFVASESTGDDTTEEETDSGRSDEAETTTAIKIECGER